MTEPERRSIFPVVIGIGATCLLLLLLAVLANVRKGVEAIRAPDLIIASAQAVDSPLVIRFRSTEPLQLRETGWGFRNFHLHASINGTEHMPAAADIVLTDSVYSWMLPSVPRGAARVYLGWADQAHRPLRDGASDTVQLEVR